MSCMFGNTDYGGPKFCILITDTYVGNIMEKIAKKSPKVDFLKKTGQIRFLKEECD